MRVATIDIGTNSVLLLVAERDARGQVIAIVERATITRLGQDVDRTGELAPEAAVGTDDDGLHAAIAARVPGKARGDRGSLERNIVIPVTGDSSRLRLGLPR